MNPAQNARLRGMVGLPMALALLAGCQQDNDADKPKPSPHPPVTLNEPVCSTLTQTTTDHCHIEATGEHGAKILTYDLTARTETVTIPVENGSQSPLTLHDALLYNASLTPERLELRRGDELRVNFKNALTIPADDRKLNELGLDAGVTPQTTNLHTHGLVTAWDFKTGTQRGDNVLSILLSSQQPSTPLPPGIDPKDMCTTGGNNTAFRYPIIADHEIGLDWYHPHPHGVTGLQVEAGMSGLLLVGDEKAEKSLHPVYLQLKDMQASKQSDHTYRFEKFEPAVATVCHDHVENEGWVFDPSEAPGRCDYHTQKPLSSEKAVRVDYSWLFLVNGQVFPSINVPQSAYLRLANSSANATYRLVLEPDVAQQQAIGSEQTYYTPPFKVVEKDGMTTVDAKPANPQELCTLAMTPATRVGVALDFKGMSKTAPVCKLMVKVAKDSSGNKVSTYNVAYKTSLDAQEQQHLAAQAKFAAFTLTQEGIDTGEDDWPAVRLAKLVPRENMAGTDLAAYRAALTEAKQHITVTAANDVKLPEDACVADHPKAVDGINRHIALFFGTGKHRGDGTATAQEQFGLVAVGEKNNDSTPVTLPTIQKWRDEYQRQFASHPTDDQGNPLNQYDKDKVLQQYDSPDLDQVALQGIQDHWFHVSKDAAGKETVKANICALQDQKPERWRIHNLSAQIHNFHLHQMKFQVVNVRGAACTTTAKIAAANPALDTTIAAAFSAKDSHGRKLVGADGYLPNGNTLETAALAGAMDEQCVKSYAELFHNIPARFDIVAPAPGATLRTETFTLPAKQDFGMHDTFPVPPMGYIDIDVLFNKPEQVGEYVFHCHILEHEDAGMMGKLVVKPAKS